MTLTREIVELGRAARNKASLKVRQPLGEARVKLPDPAARSGLEPLVTQIQEELNVKVVRFVESLDDLVEYKVKGKLGVLGPRYQRELSRVLDALGRANPTLVARDVEAGKAVTVDGYTLTPEEIEVSVTDRPGLSVAANDGLAVGVTTTLTADLIQEGLARELVHRIQTMRKAADFRIEDRITTYFETGDPIIHEVVKHFGAYVKAETLSREICAGPGPSEAYRELVSLDGHRVALAVSR